MPSPMRTRPQDAGNARGDHAGDPGESRHRDIACLARTIDAQVIPQLAVRHGVARAESGAAAEGEALPRQADIDSFLRHVMVGRHAEMVALVARLRQSGCTVERVYLNLLKPTARRLGELWLDDDIDFAHVTLACGHLQRLMRELSPEFAAEAEAAPHAHRALFVQAEGEQHSFGLSMLAEFFRRAGWDVLGGVGTATADPAERVRREWVDLVGLSVGSVPKLGWTRQAIERVRAASLNHHVVVMVGGPLFDRHPELLAEVVADGAAVNARDALSLAEALVAKRQAEAGSARTAPPPATRGGA